MIMCAEKRDESVTRLSTLYQRYAEENKTKLHEHFAKRYVQIVFCNTPCGTEYRERVAKCNQYNHIVQIYSESYAKSTRKLYERSFFLSYKHSLSELVDSV